MPWNLNVGTFVGRGRVMRQKVRSLVKQVEDRLNELGASPAVTLPRTGLHGAGPIFRSRLIAILNQVQIAANAVGASPPLNLDAATKLKTGLLDQKAIASLFTSVGNALAVLSPTPKPVNSVAPTLNLTSAIVGVTAVCAPGVWLNSPTSYTYQWFWYDSVTPISGANSSSYTPVSADVGHQLVCSVVATNAGGSATMATLPVTVIATASVTLPSNMLIAVSFVKPVGATKPCVQITRTSDSATQDIGYASNGYLDTAAIATFLGASTGRYSKYYNHGTLAEDITIPSGALYSQITSDYFGFPALSMSGLSAGIPLPSTLSVNNRLFTVVMVHSTQTSYSGAAYFQLGTAATPRPTLYCEQNKGMMLFAGDGSTNLTTPIQSRTVVTAMVSNAVNITIHQNDTTETRAAGTAGTISGGWIGYTDLAPFPNKGDLMFFGVAGADKTAELPALKSDLYAAFNVLRPTGYNIIHIGDSLGAGTGSTNGMNTSRQLQKQLVKQTNVVNNCNPGQNLAVVYSSRALAIPPAVRANQKNAIVEIGGSNDINAGAQAQALFDNTFIPLVQYVLSLPDVEKYYTYTVPPRADFTSAKETQRLAYNQLKRDGAAIYGYEVIDICADSAFDALPSYTADANNTSINSGDGIHPKNEGYAIHATYGAARVNPWLAAA
ncbi:hypothetical protein AEAC466_04405 [Asticcacaulis sp. AC466]|uniref:SGNH/GDSL hydrolase family protein n=1 Tax=Asticcacaulis sp. AC466 TaxID=1282362 RepID=UPI0003C3B487|nr:SGNH/GDSL hydrolase family protein [Asticcacaulis sp. AC466]ESQ85412.1 hypothetical protein AEAC466_04405 [Asticcacaulis sp. AC466]